MRRSRRFTFSLGLSIALGAASSAFAQARDPVKQLEDARAIFGEKPLVQAIQFEDWKPAGKFLLVVIAAIAVGAFLAYHPFVNKKATLEDLDQPKIIITYTVVGALVAIVVAHIPEMGFAIFGIGALMRFRTELGAAKETGRVILATMLGVACGLEFWLVAVFGALVAWILVAALEARKGMRMVVRSVNTVSIAQSAEVYGRVLQALGCRFSTPRKNSSKGQIAFVLRVRRSLEPEAIEARCNAEVPKELRGTVDWPEE